MATRTALSDNHMHTHYSGDSDASPLAMIRAARSLGLSGITVTDHLDLDYAHEPGLFDLDVDRYLPEMRTLAAEYSDADFTVRVGIELGLQPHLAARHHELVTTHDFALVIGSIHQVDGEDPYYDSFWEGKDISSAYRQYFTCTLENLRAFSELDTLGHLDYISRYGQRIAAARGEDGALRYEEHAAVIDEILQFLIRRDIALEVNTGSFRYGYTEPNPSYEILRRYRALGGTRLTLGADAHRPEDVAKGFASLPDWITTLL